MGGRKGTHTKEFLGKTKVAGGMGAVELPVGKNHRASPGGSLAENLPAKARDSVSLVMLSRSLPHLTTSPGASLGGRLVKNLPAMQETQDQFLGQEDRLEKGYPLQYSWASLLAQMVKNPPVMGETWVQSLG